VEGNVPEVEQACVADDDVQTDGHHHEDEDRDRVLDRGERLDYGDVRREAVEVERVQHRQRHHDDDGRQASNARGLTTPSCAHAVEAAGLYSAASVPANRRARTGTPGGGQATPPPACVPRVSPLAGRRGSRSGSRTRWTPSTAHSAR